jgi:hypothetical protein
MMVKRRRVTAAAAAQPEPEQPAEPAPKKLALVKPTEVAPDKYTERDLDDLRDSIIRARVATTDALANAGALSWQLGKELLRAKKTGLWQLRRTPDGAPAYKGEDAFYRKECGIGPTMAHYLMGVAESYPETKASRIGVTKLALLLEAHPDDRPELEAAVEQGASKRELEAEVRKRNAARHPERKRKQKPAAAARETEAPIPDEKVVTVALDGPTSAKLLVKDSKTGKVRRAQGKDVMRDPASVYGLVRCSNEGVTLRVTFRENDKGEISVTLRPKREPEEVEG